jgi:hypothetical protein
VAILLEYIEYVCPIIVLVIIIALKISVDNSVTFELFKRTFVEVPVDIMSLAISFIISYIIALVNKQNASNFSEFLAKGLIFFAFYIFLIIITVILSKCFVRQYSETEKTAFWLLGGITGYIISIPSIIHSIILLQSLGGI